MSRLSLAQQLAELAEPTPVDLDPEDLHAVAQPDDLSGIDLSAAREHYVEVAPSAIRKLQESVSDPKYEGIRTSRKQLYDNQDTDQDEESESDEELASEPPLGSDDKGMDVRGQDSSGDEPEEKDKEEGASRHEPSPPSGRDSAEASAEPQENGDLASTLRKTRESDLKKGKAVSRQLTLWDSLLDARIQLQKAVTASNRLPVNDQLNELARHSEAREALDAMLDEAALLSDELITLQENLLEQNESIHAPPRKRQKTVHDRDVPHDYSRHFIDLSEAASALEAAWHSHLVGTLAKWSAKVQAVAPNVLLGNRNAFNKDDRGKVNIVSIIDDMLRNDRDKLLSRTRTRRSKAQRIGAHTSTESENREGEDQEDPEVFDDTDFYQQLLRDVIRARNGDAGEQDWVAAQKENRARRKARVDTKASKGRKLRYEVHAKLQNFMVPVPVSRGEWHEEQIDALFSSLLGAA